MYTAYFGLRHRPFRPTPDRNAYYPATSHEVALGQLRQALADGEGLAMLSGDAGTGKTLLCHCLLDTAADASAFLTNSHFPDRAGLLQAILFDLSLPYDLPSEQQLRLALTDYLLTNLAQGRRAVVVVDEAQHLTPDLLEELRLLGNAETPEGKALQIILVGQPALEQTLALPELEGFRQRLAVRARLEPLGRHEAADYLAHQLRLAGGRPERLFTDEALDLIARAANGVPRLLNQAAHQCLCFAFQNDLRVVDAEVAVEACTMLELPVEDPPEEAELSVLPEEQEGYTEPEETSRPRPELDCNEPDEDDSPSGLFASPTRPA
jgi:type II secretory pathway predicted ATPase ExeA